MQTVFKNSAPIGISDAGIAVNAFWKLSFISWFIDKMASMLLKIAFTSPSANSLLFFKGIKNICHIKKKL
jgi:hypothetical protein